MFDMSSRKQHALWNGYRPAPRGKSQAYHVKKSPSEGLWAISCVIGDAEYFCVPAPECDTDIALKGAIEIGYIAGVAPGGTLTVNEYKDVVKTAYSKSKGINARFLVGNHQNFHVVFPGRDGPIDNGDSRGLEIGSPWPFQRVGTRYHYRPSEDDILMIYGDWELEIKVSFKKFFEFNFRYIFDQLAIAKDGKGGQFYVN